MKKLFVGLLLLFAMILQANAVTIITSCPTWSAGETYLVPENFIPSECTINEDNITIKQEDPDLKWDFNLRFIFDGDNITVEDFYIKSLTFEFNSGASNLLIQNNIIYDIQDHILDHISQSGSKSSYNMTFYNNYFESKYNNINFFSGSLGGGGGTFYHRIYDLNLTDNTFINFKHLTSGQTFGASRHYDYIYDIYFKNNILDFENPASSNSGFTFTDDGTPTITEDNFLGWATLTQDLDNNKEDDNFYTYGAYNARPLIQKEITSLNDLEKTTIVAQKSKGTPSYYDSNKDYFFVRDQTFDASNYLNFEGKQNINFYLFDELTLTGVNQIRGGVGNSIIGRNRDLINNVIESTGSIIATFDSANPELSNHALVTYNSKFTMENLDINLLATGNYGFLRKNGNVDGQEFNLKNSEFYYGFTPTTIDTPAFIPGYKMNIINNIIDFGDNTNSSFIPFLGGSGGGLAGGHLIIDNVFKDGGLIFQYLAGDPNQDLESSYIHNSFERDTQYSFPYESTGSSLALEYSPSLNGDYFYKTVCDSYRFNLGNYYEDYDDSPGFTDTNTDGINDNPIFRGKDLNSVNITDDRPLISYPYDFVSNLGNAEETLDLCGILNFNIIQPTEQNYSSGTEITTNWEYSSVSYDNLVCFEELNGFQVIYTNVSSGDNKGVEWDTTDGAGLFQVTCCDNEQCSNIVKQSELIEFCIGDCNIGNLIVNDVSTPTPGDNGDNGEDNGGDSEGVDITGGITISGIFNEDPSESTDALVATFQLLETPLGYIMLLGFIFMAFAILSFIVVFTKSVFT